MLGNLARLSAALDELDARIRTDAAGDGLAFDHDAASLRRADVWNLICAAYAADYPSALPITERLAASVLSLPISPELGEDACQYVSRALVEAVSE